MVPLTMNPAIDKSSSDGASSSGSEINYISHKGMTSMDSAVHILKSTFFDGVVVSVKTESQVFP